MVNITRAADLTIIGSTGGGWVADTGTAAPASPILQPQTPWDPLGCISDDGLVYGFDEDSQEFTPWGLTSPIRTTITKSVRTFKIVLWETGRVAVNGVMYRKSSADLTPDVDGLTSFAESGAPTPDRRAWWFIVMDGANARGFYVPQGEISDRSDVTFKQDTMSAYEITVTAYPDDAGNTVYQTLKVPTTPEYAGS
jgi:hypothetical protein